MSLSRRAPFGGLFSAGGTAGNNKSLGTGIPRTDTNSSLSLSSLEISDNEKGALGLTTLHEPLPPKNPTVDLVFIHGLGGGSRKTWSFSPDVSHYWPLSWLPNDADFADVRIHTFGYKADWAERRESTLNIHDFAQSLLGELRNHPGIRRTATRIILIGHSMGGCVAKMVYILARQDPAAADIATRFHSIFFLGTPHRGSDMANILESMLTVAWGRKAYVTDLLSNSKTLSSINDTFRHYAPSLRLWSFFETLPVRAGGIANRIVVEKYSATLGYNNEEISAMDADHRQVCKFESVADPNYKRLRNALVTAIDMIKTDASASSAESKGEEKGKGVEQPQTALPLLAKSMTLAEANSRLRSFLNVRDSPEEDDLVSLHILKQPGSCRWFTHKDSFSSWDAGTGPGVLWLMGRPAAGKSVLASHVIEKLRQRPQVYCSYFIFKHGEMGKSSLRDCFKSLALQMASHDIMVREALLQLAQDGLVYDMMDDASIWRRLFIGSIFKLPSISRHRWVIDGVDECANFNSLFTKKFLATAPDQLRIFATSRAWQEIERGAVGLGANRCALQVLSETDTVGDMKLFLSTRLEEIGRPEDPHDRERMCQKILEKSSGSFLWTRIVLREFESAWTEEAMNAILEEVPADLQELYYRMLRTIEADPQKLPLAKSILSWLVLASRPLTTQELRCAVKLDVGQTLQDVGKAIPDVCGQLVWIDKDDRVHMIHETAREFLSARSDTPQSSTMLLQTPFIARKEGHTRIGRLLLHYLRSEGLKSQKGTTQQGSGRPRGFARAAPVAPSADLSLLEYACGCFSDHLCFSTAEDDTQMEELAGFLKAPTVLLWIEYIAKSGDLTDVTRAAVNMREYLIRRMKYVPPTHPTVHLVDQWVTDLIRVAAKFRSQLLASPQSIHSLIPPLCPTDSIIAQTFGRDAKRASVASSTLVVKGLPPGNWDDCLMRLDFEKGQTTTICHGERFFAIGLTTGSISLYDPGSVQYLLRLSHPERVRILQFSRDDLHLASCGAKRLCVWDPLSGTMRHTFQLRSAPLAIMFLGREELLCALQSSETTRWDLETEEQDTLPWVGANDLENEYAEPIPMQDMVPSQPPSRVAFLTASNDEDPVLMAVGYRSHPVLIWHALELRILGLCEHGIENNGIDAMVFNPTPDIPALVVSYQDGSVCVFDYLEMELQTLVPGVFAHSLACSLDGRSLIIGSNQGLIEVYDFERDSKGGLISLVLIYRTSHPLDQTIRGVAFSTDGLRFMDVRGQQGRVWAPAALVRKSANEAEDSVIDSAPGDASSLVPPKPSMGIVHSLGNAAITSPLRATMDGRYIVTGNGGGEVALFSTANASLVAVLYQHARGASVVNITLGEVKNIVISADDSGRILVAQLRAPMSRLPELPKPQRASIVIDKRFGTAVARMLVNATIDRLLICGRRMDELWEIPSGRVIVDRPHSEVTGATPNTEAHAIHPLPSVSSSSVSTISSGRTDMTAPLHAAHSHSAFRHPSCDDWFVLVTGEAAHIYAWSDFSEQTTPEGIRLERIPMQDDSMSESTPDPHINWSIATANYHVAPGFVTELVRPSPSESPRLYLWPATELDPASGKQVARPAAEPNLEAISPAVRDVLGMAGPATLVFLDANLWVCSTELQTVSVQPTPSTSSIRSIRPTNQMPPEGFQPLVFARTSSSRSLPHSKSSPSSRQGSWSLEAKVASEIPTPKMHARRHFFALSEWQRTGVGERLRCTLATSSLTSPREGKKSVPGGSRDVVFATGPHLVVIKGGFEFSENIRASHLPFMTDAGRFLWRSGTTNTQPPTSSPTSGGGQYTWEVVSGSMSRRLMSG